MNLLAIDTSTGRAAIALLTDAGAVLVANTEPRRRHGRDLIPRLKDILASAAIRVDEIGAIAVGLGPGSYTGLRVGITAAKTLAYATGASLIGLDSLHAIARNAPTDALRVSVIADAQRGEVYVAELIRPVPGAALMPAAETHIESFSSWLGRLDDGTAVLGPGLEAPRVRAAIPAAFLPPNEDANYPRGECVIDLAREAWAGGCREDIWLLEPRYLRRSAAEDQWDSRVPTPPG